MFDFASLTILNQFNAHRMRENIGHRVFIHMAPHSLSSVKKDVHLKAVSAISLLSNVWNLPKPTSLEAGRDPAPLNSYVHSTPIRAAW